MALAHIVGLRNAVADLLATRLGAGFRVIITTTANGLAGTTLANMVASGTPNAAATGIKDFFSGTGAIADATGNAGTAAGFRITNAADSSAELSGALGDGITLSSNTIGAGDTISISALTYTAPV